MAGDGREGGYIKLYRSLESSEDFVGLRADQCWVAARIIQLANFKPGFHRFRGQAIEVGRGELAHTLETIAARSNSTIKVVRTTVARLLRSGFLGSRTGTVAGTGYRILIVNNYDRFQGDTDDAGTVAGTATGSDRAATGHGPGSDRALREEGEEGKKGRIIPTTRMARVGPGHPAFEAIEHWLKAVWPRLSTAEPAPVTGAQGVTLAELTVRLGSAELKARMDRAAADEWWRKTLTLDRFIANVETWAERKAGPGKAKVTAEASDRSAFGKGEVAL